MRRRALLLALAPLLALAASPAAVGSAAAGGSERTGTAARSAPMIAYVQVSGTGDEIWVRALNRRRARRLGAGEPPLLSPDGRSVAASTPAAGPALTVFSTAGHPAVGYLSAELVSASPVAGSADSRYLAVEVYPQAAGAQPGLEVVDMRRVTITRVADGTPCGASFSPAAPRRLVFSLAMGDCLYGSMDLFVAAPDGGGRTRLTQDRRSAFPVWGRAGIAFDRITPRTGDASPLMQIWLTARGGSPTQLTTAPVPPRLDGLLPVEFSADGQRLLAGMLSPDGMPPWAVSLPGGAARQIGPRGGSVQPDAISRDGSIVLMDLCDGSGGAGGTVATVPFSGGPLRTLLNGAHSASWNR